ncbi:hypothetical protein [Mycobacteroides abscessus]|uniref:hypothetical protein n=1 Tax=Mycobacteroides abscessus TaxID=36809 RepID=UPI000926C79F|nr:hypothetical protein [Mycobacteroides abscessus]SIB65802.1 Uncharacterised protein [Mycobacteroides abscessus subsp. abscessus]
MKIKPSDLANKAGNVIHVEDLPDGVNLQPDESLTAGTPIVTVTNTDDPEMFRTFTDQALAPIGENTDDRRRFAKDIEMSFRSFPQPLMWCRQSKGGHDDSFTVGVIESARVEGDKLLASGYLLNTPEADEMAMQNAHGVSNPSVDLGAADYTFTDADGNELDDDAIFDALFFGEGELYYNFTKAKLLGATMVSTPAFDTRVHLDAERSPREVALVASAQQAFAPKVYDHRMFEDPKLSGLTLPTIDENGRIYGHLAAFGTCHRSVQESCTLVPRSNSGYREFHTSPAVRLDNGTRLPVGRLTVGCGHADTRLPGIPATAHYDNAGSAFALVRVGEDKHGIWFSGVAAPWATPEQIEMGLSAPLSGDWRNFGQGLELVAALAVNTPGFNVRAGGTTDDDGLPFAMVASGRLSSKIGTTRGATLRADQIQDAVAAGVVKGMERLSAASQAAEEAAARAAHVSEVDKAMLRVREVVPAPKSVREQIGEKLAARAV